MVHHTGDIRGGTSCQAAERFRRPLQEERLYYLTLQIDILHTYIHTYSDRNVVD
jgi:hypothetical protein